MWVESAYTVCGSSKPPSIPVRALTIDSRTSAVAAEASRAGKISDTAQRASRRGCRKSKVITVRQKCVEHFRCHQPVGKLFPLWRRAKLHAPGLVAVEEGGGAGVGDPAVLHPGEGAQDVRLRRLRGQDVANLQSARHERIRNEGAM